jgi:archaellin
MIAFVVVASVFAMTTLQTGVFSAEQGQEVAYSGLDQATGSLQLRGSVRAIRGDVDVDGNDTILLSGVDDQAVVKVVFTVTGMLGGTMTDLTPPYTANDTATDPDASGLTSRTSRDPDRQPAHKRRRVDGHLPRFRQRRLHAGR